jgi:hypothetical protein
MDFLQLDRKAISKIGLLTISAGVREKLYNFTAHLACGEIEPLGHIILVKGFLQHEDV